MTTSPPPKPRANKDFLCSCGRRGRSACRREGLYTVSEGNPYCVLHYPGTKSGKEFEEAVYRKLRLEDHNFSDVWFSAYEFCETEFSEAFFIEAFFSTKVRFNHAVFNKGVAFSEATFREVADFRKSIFNRVARFGGAKFAGPVDFEDARFHSFVTFDGATFADQVRFVGNNENTIFGSGSTLTLQFAKFEKPHLVSFHTVRLRPSWFINVDSRKFEFTNVDWEWRSVRSEITRLRRDVPNSHRMLAIAYRNLAVNAEENHRYEEASRFRYMAMDARRIEHWRGMDFHKLSWWYWLASGYGERIGRAALVLFFVFFLSALLYTQVGFARWESRVASEREVATVQKDEVGAPLKFARALTYSAAVMTFQRPEPRPATTAAQTIVLFETVLGPVQAALLALAIRRKFMR